MAASSTLARVTHHALHGLEPRLWALVEGSLRLLQGLRADGWVAGFSGGKDSTVLLHLTVLAAERGWGPRWAVAFYNDTMDELPGVREWALATLRGWEGAMRSAGVEAEARVTKPLLGESFHWRVAVRGYVAPNYKFRWCTKLLKILPTRRLLTQLPRRGRVAVLVGSRDDESSARRRGMARKSKAPACPVGSCTDSVLLETDYPAVKAAPLRHWTTRDVWGFLASTQPPWREPGYDVLASLYGGWGGPARFGCWHCLVSKAHLGLRVALDAEPGLRPLAALRRLLHALTEEPLLREAKTTGYSRLGGLNLKARGVYYSALRLAAEKLPQRLLYGVHEPLPSPLGPLSLKEAVLDATPREAEEAIRAVDKSPRARRVTREVIEEWQDHPARVAARALATLPAARAKPVLQALREFLEALGEESESPAAVVHGAEMRTALSAS